MVPYSLYDNVDCKTVRIWLARLARGLSALRVSRFAHHIFSRHASLSRERERERKEIVLQSN